MPRTKQRKRQQEPQTQMAQQTQPYANIERFYPDPSVGLTTEQVGQRISQGLNNEFKGVETKTEGQIIKGNVFTFFNILNFIMLICVVLVGDLKNATFIAPVLWNIIIGSFQEIRSKRTIDKLSLVSAPKTVVMRNGKMVQIPVADIVLDDMVILNSGNQIASDAIVSYGELEVNESMITGESDPVTKKSGDKLLSGSFVISGKCYAQVEHVGKENYATQIAGNAKYVKPRTSQIMNSIDTIIKIVGFMLLPVGFSVLYKSRFVLGGTTEDAVVNAVGSMIGMIPEGLVLLTSIVFAVSVMRLALNKTLVQDLYCVETLARVDVLCLDKTGTITEGTMQVDELIPFQGYSEKEMETSMALLVGSLNDENPTFQAVSEYVSGNVPARKTDDIIPFSSARKWSGAHFNGLGALIMGACEFILGADFEHIKHLVEPFSKNGQRVLLLARSQQNFNGKELPDSIECIGLIVISDKIRREARRTLRYFADQGVDLKVISGDNAITVSNIAKRAGLENADKYIDATTIRTDDELKRAVNEYAVFGRVTPQQKLKFVQALKEDGHTVAMTGDGVNDVLALKEADCSIAMASGSDAARTVSSLVLLDSNFSSMPLAVQEGRRSINNLQRSSTLFLAKTLFSTLIGILFIFLNYAYPFQPIHLTIISVFTIGIPSFALALEPNRERVKGSFINNVISKSVPAGITMAANMVMLCILCSAFGLSNDEMSSLAVIITALTGFVMLIKVCTPFNALRVALCTVLIAAFAVTYVIVDVVIDPMFLKDGKTAIFADFNLPMFIILIVMVVFAISLFILMTHLVDNVIQRRAPVIKKRKVAAKKKKRQAN